MGISVGGKGGAMAEPNIVPLIDILLVLIIIFMVVTPLTPKGLEALVPQSDPDSAQNQAEPDIRTVVVQIECVPTCDFPGVKINQEDSTWDQLQPRLTDIFAKRAEKVAFVKGADQIEWRHVARAIDIMKASGIDKVGLITAKIEQGG
ncbi:MAG: ExbD/TolR family protein [Terriglobia bacterium]